MEIEVRSQTSRFRRSLVGSIDVPWRWIRVLLDDLTVTRTGVETRTSFHSFTFQSRTPVSTFIVSHPTYSSV